MSKRPASRSGVLAALLLGGLAAGPVAAEGIAVIASRAVPPAELGIGLLRDIYLKKVFLDDGGRKYIPVNLPVEHPLRRALSAHLFSLSSADLQDYWNQRYFHGITPPYVLGSQDAVMRFVAKTPGAIGYVASCQVTPEVQVLLTLPVEPAMGLDFGALCPAPAGRGGTGS